MSKDPEKMTDEERVEAGIPTDYTVENLCCQCGDDLERASGGGWVEVEGAPYGRPAITVGVHVNCLTDENVRVGPDETMNEPAQKGACEECGKVGEVEAADTGQLLCWNCMWENN